MPAILEDRWGVDVGGILEGVGVVVRRPWRDGLPSCVLVKESGGTRNGIAGMMLEASNGHAGLMPHSSFFTPAPLRFSASISSVLLSRTGDCPASASCDPQDDVLASLTPELAERLFKLLDRDRDHCLSASPSAKTSGKTLDCFAPELMKLRGRSYIYEYGTNGARGGTGPSLEDTAHQSRVSSVLWGRSVLEQSYFVIGSSSR